MEIQDEMFGTDVMPAEWAEKLAEDMWTPYEPGEEVSPKMDSVAAAILHIWSLDSAQDEESGTSDYGNGWHALFRDERAILHVNSQGFVYAWRVPESDDPDTVWEEIQAGAVYPDDECENGSPSCTEDDPCVVCNDA